jgi:glycosyltransferase involved in cell wall biosynthesis
MAIPQPRPAPAPGSLRHAWRGARRFASPRRIAATWRFAAAMVAEIRRRRTETRLTVAVDINSLFEALTGVGWYLHQLLAELAGRDDLRLRLYGQSLVDESPAPPLVVAPPAGPAIERVLYRAPDGLVVPPWRAHQLLRRLAPLLAAADGNRVLFAPNYLPPRLFRFARGARVATVHDLAVRRLPWAVRPDSAAALLAGLDRALFEADLLLTPSAAVRDDLVACGVAAERVVPIHHGPGQQPALVCEPTAEPGSADRCETAVPREGAAAPHESLADPRISAHSSSAAPSLYGLHVGTLEPRKNLPVLLAAWRLLRARLPGAPPLVLAGAFGWGADALRCEVERAVAEGWLRPLGYVPAAELADLYRGATVVVLPSLYEGFGLPAVEAMAAGAPLVVSDIPVLHEVAGDAALYAPPDRPERWADALARLLGDPALRRELAARGRLRRELFDWSRAADSTVAAWRAAVRAAAG